jgi:hypothetical protein
MRRGREEEVRITLRRRDARDARRQRAEKAFTTEGTESTEECKGRSRSLLVALVGMTPKAKATERSVPPRRAESKNPRDDQQAVAGERNRNACLGRQARGASAER